MRVVFMGTPLFAGPTLELLVESRCFNIVGIFSQPDRPKGRGQSLRPLPVKKMAQHFNLPLFQPLMLDTNTIGTLWSKLRPDVVVVVAYGFILPSWILHSTRFGCINLHASLLPLYRGAAPINWAIINGDKVTGVTTMLMDEGVDTGAILMQAKTTIESQDTADTLHDRLSLLGADLMLKTLNKYTQGKITPQKQPEQGATLAPKLDKEMGRLDWSMDNYSLWYLIRGIPPHPGAFTFLNDRQIKIWRSEPLEDSQTNHPPGTICGVDHHLGLIIQTGKGKLGVQEIQPQNKKRMSAGAFVHGYRLDPVGSVFKRFPSQR